MSKLVCSKCGGPFGQVEIDGKMQDFPFPEDWTQDDIDFMNMVCVECTPKRMRDLRKDDFDEIEKAGGALGRFGWLYRHDYQPNAELEAIMDRILEAIRPLKNDIERLQELDSQKCREINKMFWTGEANNEVDS